MSELLLKSLCWSGLILADETNCGPLPDSVFSVWWLQHSLTLSVVTVFVPQTVVKAYKSALYFLETWWLNIYQHEVNWRAVRLQMHALFHRQCQAVEDFYGGWIWGGWLDFCFRKYLLIIMLAVQSIDHDERRMEAGWTLKIQWYYFRWEIRQYQ